MPAVSLADGRKAEGQWQILAAMGA